MSRLAIPIFGRTLQATGDLLLQARLDLVLKDNSGVWWQETFVVDSGTEMTTFHAARARQLNLPMPLQAVVGVRHNQTGQVFRSAYLRAQVVGMDATEYVFPCFFLGDPSSPLPATP